MKTMKTPLPKATGTASEKVKHKNKFSMNKYLMRITLVFALALVWGQGYGQMNGDYQTRAAGNWNANTTWQVWSSGAWVNCAVGDYPGAAAGAGTVTVLNNQSVSITANVPNAIGALTVDNGANPTSVSFSGAFSLTVTNAATITANINGATKSVDVSTGTLTTGSISINSAAGTKIAQMTVSTGTINCSGNLSFTGTAANAPLTFTGSGIFNIGGTFAPGAFACGTGTVNFNGTGAQTVPAFSYYNLTISNARTTNSVTLVNAGTIGVANTFSPTATFTSGAYVNTGNTVDFNGTGAQTVPAFNYNNLTVSGVRTSNSVTLANVGTIGVAAVFNPSATFTSGAFVLTGSTVDFNGDVAQNIPAFTFNNLSSSNVNGASVTARTKTLTGNVVVNGILNITGLAAATVSLSPAALNITVNGATNINAYGILNDATNGGADIFAGLVTIAANGQFLNPNNSTDEFRGGITNNGTFTKSGSGNTSFTTNSQTLSGANVLTFSGGDIIISHPTSLSVSTDISFSGTNLTNSSNTSPAFNATAGTFTFLPNAAQNINGAGTGSITFYKLTAAGGNTKTATTQPFNVSNDLTINSGVTLTTAYGTASTYNFGGATAINGTGTLNLGTVANIYNLSGSLTVDGTLNFGTLAAKTVSVSGDLIDVTGTITMPSNLAHNLNLGGANNAISTFTSVALSTVTYNRAGDQQIFTSLNYQNLTISGGGNKALQGTSSVAGVLTLNSGVVQLANFNLTLNNNAANAVQGTPSSTSMIANTGSGDFIRNAAAITNGAILFPVGAGGYYSQVSITAITGGTTGVINVKAAAPGSLGTKFLNKYWDIITSVGSKTITATFQYNPAEKTVIPTNIFYKPAAGNWSAPIGTASFGTNTFTVTGTTNMTTTTTSWTAGALGTYYSYQNGDWNTPSTWTSDPSGTTQVGTTVPGFDDVVVILSGRIVNLPANITATGIDITINAGGILDMSTFQFANGLLKLSGQGTLAISSGVFPTPITTNTFTNAGGGTVEYRVTANLPTQATYNNLTINAPGFIVTQNILSMTLNGNLYVKHGTFQINDITAQRVTLTVNGNVTVAAGASITVGTGVTNTVTSPIGLSGGAAPFLDYYDKQSHRIVLKGDFTNNGTVRFTNLTYPVYNAFPPTTVGATTGFATVYFQGASDNTMTCSGTTDFYNLVLDKGIDQTFKLTVYTSAYSDFRLFGANTAGLAVPATANPDMKKALWIRTGTLVLQGTTIIPSLTEGDNTETNSDYYIPAKGSLILDGTSVVVLSTADDYREVNLAYSTSAPDNPTMGINTGGAGCSLTLYGKLQLNDGYLSTRESGGIITSNVAAGQFIINNGTVDAKQFLGSTGVASFNQNGGLFVLRGRFQRTFTYASVSNLTDVSATTLNTARAANGTTTGFGSFNLENTGNVFAMTGGTMRIYDVCDDVSQKAFDVKSSSAYINVTGGTLEIIPTLGSGLPESVNYLINTKAALNNLIVNRASGTAVVQLNTNSVVVLNGLTLTSGDFSANGLDLTVGGNFTIQNGTTYTSGTNTTTLNGTGTQTFTVNLTGALSLNKFTIAKTTGVAVNFAGTQHTISINDNLRIVSGTLNDNGDTINVYKDVYNSGLHTGTGKIAFVGTVAQAIDGSGIFNNVELNNNTAVAAPVSLAANMTVNGTLKFSRDKLFNIGTYNLTLNSSASIVNGGALRYIETSGNAGDGGLTRVYSTIAAFVFPIGAPTVIPVKAVKYTPATIGFTTAPTTYGSVTVVPVGYEHPATTVNGQSLTYFWRVKSSGFAGIVANSVTHTFVYDPSDVVGTEANYIPTLYDRSNYVWKNGTNANPPINTTTHTITDWSTPTGSAAYLDADYTAGDNAFGTVTVFYSRANGFWDVNSTWSTDPILKHTGAAAASYPKVNDVAIIGNGNTVTLQANANCASLQIQAGSVLDISTFTGSVFSMVLNHTSGTNGLFRLTTSITGSNVPKLFSFPSNSDFSDFNNNHGTTEYYDIDGTQGAVYILPANVTTYGNLMVTAKGGDNLVLPNNALTTVQGDLSCGGDNSNAWIAVSWNTNVAPYNSGVYNPTVEKTIHITGNLNVNNGTLIYMDDFAPQHIIVDGNMTVAPIANVLANPPTSGYYNINGAPQANTLAIGGSLYNNTNAGNSITLKSLSNVNALIYYCDVTFFGSNNAILSNTSGTPTTVFNKVTINKGTSQATTLTCNIGGTLSTLTDGWLTLLNGTFKYMRPDPKTDFTISTTSAFTIPETAGLYVNYSNANNKNILIANDNTVNSNDVFLNGQLTLVAGNIYIGQPAAPAFNNDIEYSGGGVSGINVQGGNLVVNGQIRQNPSSTAGILTYRQSGGAVTINGNNANTTNAKLEVMNSGEFTMSAGTLTIVGGGGGTTYGDLYLRPGTGTVSGGDIIFSNNSLNGSIQNYLLDATIPLNNLTITGRNTATTANATVKLLINPLSLNGNLTLTNAQSIFDVNTLYNLPVTIKGNFTNNGAYNHYNNLTTFNGGTQSLLGTNPIAATDFYDLDVNPVTKLTLIKTITVTHNLTLSSGTLECTTFKVNVNGNVANNATYTNTNATSGMVLNGAALQHLSGTGTFGQLELNNASGAVLDNSITLNAITTNNDLVLTTGILDIKSQLLNLGVNTNIVANGTAFSVSKMITTDGVWSGVGINKVFPIIASSTAFTYPLGVTGKYTPAVLTITANTSVGSIRLNNINSHHPAVLDPTNVLNYYWEAASSGITSLTGNLLLNYKTSDVVGGPESNYVAAELLTPGTNWGKAAPGSGTDNVDEAAHTITFLYTTSSNLTGEYTAGNDAAIPNTVPQYTSINDGDWTNPLNWTPSGGTSYPCPAGGPNGFIVTINNVITANANYCFAYKTTINNELKAIAATYGHNFGTVDGFGTLYLESAVFPAGRYSAFLDCSGTGTLEYGGSGTYNITADLYSSVPNMLITGTGTRVLPDKDLTICHQLIIDDGGSGALTLDNSTNNRSLTIEGTFERYNNGSFNSGTGTNATVSFAGSAPQTIGGSLGDFEGTNKFNNFEINNSNGLTVNTGGNIEVDGNLLLTNGLISTTSTNKLTITNSIIGCVFPDGGSATSYIDGPLIKSLNQGDHLFKFPVGKQSYGLGNKLSLRATQTGTLLWTVEYFNPNPYLTYVTPLTAVSTKEYWNVSGVPGTSQAYINLTWDNASDINPFVTQNGMSDMRIAEYNGTDWQQILSTVTGGSTNSNGSVESSSLAVITSGSRNYSLSCINTPKARIRLTPGGPICGVSTIPVTLTTSLAVTSPYTVNYTENGTPKSISPASFPASISTTVGGATYILTGFTYTLAGIQTGVVDPTPVISNPVPTTADAGPDQSLCGASSATLAGNAASVGTGLWTISLGSGGTVTLPTHSNSPFTGINGNGYTLTWTITSGSGAGACVSSDNVDINFPLLAAQPGAFAVGTTPVCQSMTGITYAVPNDPTASSYNWSYIGGTGATITGTTNSVSLDFNGSATTGTLRVTVTNGCSTSAPRDYLITVNPRGSWTGLVNSDWFNNNNWSCPGIPTSTSDVVIPASASHMPVITGTGAVCRGMTIQSGASLDLGSQNLDVYGDWTNNNVLTATNLSTVTFKGTTTVGGSSVSSFGNVIIDPSASLTAPSGNMDITGSWTDNGTFVNNSGTLIFNGASTQTINTSAVETFNNFTVSTGSDVSLSSSSKLTVNGNTMINGTYRLKSNSALPSTTASFIPSGAYDQTGGTVYSERFLNRVQWHLVFSPLDNVNKTVFTTTSYGATNPNFYWYNEATADYWNGAISLGTTGWSSVPAGSLSINKGYIQYSNEDRTYQLTGGNLLGTDKTFTLSYTLHSGALTGAPGGAVWNDFDGWNLIGNPYTASVDWDAVSRVNTDNAAYYYNGTNYVYYGAGGIGINGGSRYIPANQGVYVKVSSNAAASVTIPKSSRTHNATTFFEGDQTIPNLVRMQIEANGFTDETVVRLSPEATDNFEGNYDMYKKFSWDNTKPQLYTLNAQNTHFALNSFAYQGETKDVPVGFYIGSAGTYTINFIQNSVADENVYFEDRSAGRTFMVNSAKTYTFSASAGTNNTRFVLHFNLNHAPVVVDQPTDVNINEKESFTKDISGIFNDPDSYDSYVLQVTDTSGAVLPNWINSNQNTVSGTPTAENIGTYTVKITATDHLQASTSVYFTITVSDIPPQVVGTMPNQSVYQDVETQFAIPDGIFYEPDSQNVLTYLATDNLGNALPSWIQFNSETKTFTAIAGNNEVGNYIFKITATDLANASVSTTFNLEVINVNDPPILSGTISDVTTYEDQPIQFTIDQNTFTDIDFGDYLTYSVSGINGENLPNWISFDSETRQFTANPTYENIGSYTFKVTATDNSGASALTTFNLTVSNVPPQLIGTMINQSVYQGIETQITIPEGIFYDADSQDILTYSATDNLGNPLSSWIQFNSETKTFTVNAGNSQVGNYTIRIAATDLADASVSTTFNLEVINVNDAPILVNPIADTSVWVGNNLQYGFGQNTFADIDTGDNLTYFANLENGNSLPDWLSFDPTARLFSGIPPTGSEGVYNIRVTAADNSSATAVDVFKLTVTGTSSVNSVGNLTVVMYPNPSAGIFKILLPAKVKYKLQISDITGNIILTDNYFNQNQEINLSDRESGIYFVKITTDNQTIFGTMIITR
jgi:hypothetical protein